MRRRAGASWRDQPAQRDRTGQRIEVGLVEFAHVLADIDRRQRHARRHCRHGHHRPPGIVVARPVRGRSPTAGTPHGRATLRRGRPATGRSRPSPSPAPPRPGYDVTRQATASSPAGTTGGEPGQRSGPLLLTVAMQSPRPGLRGKRIGRRSRLDGCPARCRCRGSRWTTGSSCRVHGSCRRECGAKRRGGMAARVANALRDNLCIS